MIEIYKELRFIWSCPNCKEKNSIYGDPKYKDKIICQHCRETFTEFKDECDEE